MNKRIQNILVVTGLILILGFTFGYRGRYAPPEIKSGMIIMWSGAIADIPSGWTFCNGSNGTPDLRDKFVVGAGTTYNPADTGGAATHIHSVVAEIGAGDIQEMINADYLDVTDAGSNLPPYYSLAYIMKK